MKRYKIASIPADGIGPEVIAAGLQALDVLAKRDGGFALDVTAFDWGSDRYKRTGLLMPADGTKTLAAFALGLILFVVTLVLNIIALHVVRKYREQYE